MYLNLSFTVVDLCNKRIQLERGSSALITSPNWPQKYPSNSTCTYNITSPDPDGSMMIKFETFQLEYKDDCG